MRQILDDEGENLAVRSFLMQYSCDRSITAEEMCRHMKLSGWDEFWPTWAPGSNAHLTKAGAQIWLRLLFNLEDLI